MGSNIKQGIAVLAISKQVHRLVTKCRKRRKSAQYTDKDKRPRVSRKNSARVCQIRKKTNDKASGEIDCKCPVRETDAAAQALHIAARKIAQNGPGKSAKADI